MVGPVSQDALADLLRGEPLDVPRDDDGVRVPHRVDPHELFLQLRDLVQPIDEFVLQGRQCDMRLLRLGHAIFSFGPIPISILRWRCRLRTAWHGVCGLIVTLSREGQSGGGRLGHVAGVFHHVDDGLFDLALDLPERMHEALGVRLVLLEELDALAGFARGEREARDREADEERYEHREEGIDGLRTDRCQSQAICDIKN